MTLSRIVLLLLLSALCTLGQTSGRSVHENSREELATRISEYLFPKYRSPSSRLPLGKIEIERELDRFGCPRLKQLVFLLDSLRDQSVTVAHSGRSEFFSGSYDIKLFTADQYRDVGEKGQYWLLKDADYFSWRRSGFLDVPPAPRNGFKSKEPAYHWVREKFGAIIQSEMDRCASR